MPTETKNSHIINNNNNLKKQVKKACLYSISGIIPLIHFFKQGHTLYRLLGMSKY